MPRKARVQTSTGVYHATQFQALPRPEQKHYLYEAHEAGVGPRTLLRLTGVPYSIVQRATSGKTVNQDPSAIVSEPDPWDELYETYLNEGDFEQYPEY